MIKRILHYFLHPVFKYLKWYENFVIPNFKTRVTYFLQERPIINQKFFLTGEGKITIGEGCMFGYKSGGFNYKGSIEFQARTKDSEIIIGSNVKTNNNIFICSSGRIEIKKDTLIGQGVCIMDFEAHGIPPDKRRNVGEIGFVEIGENVWIGNNVTILKNSSIGKNSIVATGAVISGKFPENVIIGGVPGKVIRSL